jgi:uncharacterized OB-fold protein
MESQAIQVKAVSAPKKRRYYKSPRKKKVKSGRICRACGNDPYPNYFYCPSCHHKVSNFED